MGARHQPIANMNVDEALAFLENFHDDLFTDSKGIKDEQKSLDLYIEPQKTFHCWYVAFYLSGEQ